MTDRSKPLPPAHPSTRRASNAPTATPSSSSSSSSSSTANTTAQTSDASNAAVMSKTRSTSPYGTRSRNRSTAARINYAEDKDNEMDYELANASNGTSQSTHQASASN